MVKKPFLGVSLTLAALACFVSAAHASPPRIESDSLVPRWASSKLDYTTLCESRVSFRISTKSKLSFAGKRARKGIWRESVSLSPGQAVRLRVGGQTYVVRCRPSDLPLPDVRKYGPVQGRFYLATPNITGDSSPTNHYVLIFDGNGVPVWWSESEAELPPLDFKAIDRKTLAWTTGIGALSQDPDNRYEIRNLDGSLKRTVKPVGYGADHHDLEPTADGNWLLISYVSRDCPAVPSDCVDLSQWGGPSAANVIDGVIQKVAPDGRLLWSWNSRDHIDTDESDSWIPRLLSTTPDGVPFDLVHLNSVEDVPGGVIFSARHLDAVYRIRYSDGGINWKLGGTSTPERLDIVGDRYGEDALSGQHDARLLPNGNVTVHDNGTLPQRPPRMVRFEIADGKATLRGEVSDPLVSQSFCCGGGRKLASGNWVVNWGGSGITGEYRPSGALVLSLSWPPTLFSYRLNPAPFLRLGDLRQGMDRQFPR